MVIRLRCSLDTLALEEQDRWVLAVIGAKSEARITLTYPALDSSRDAVFPGQEPASDHCTCRSAIARCRPPAGSVHGPPALVYRAAARNA